MISVAIVEEGGNCHVHQQVLLLVAAMSKAALGLAVVQGSGGCKAVEGVLQVLLGRCVKPRDHQMLDLQLQMPHETQKIMETAVVRGLWASSRQMLAVLMQLRPSLAVVGSGLACLNCFDCTCNCCARTGDEDECWCV